MYFDLSLDFSVEEAGSPLKGKEGKSSSFALSSFSSFFFRLQSFNGGQEEKEGGRKEGSFDDP